MNSYVPDKYAVVVFADRDEAILTTLGDSVGIAFGENANFVNTGFLAELDEKTKVLCFADENQDKYKKANALCSVFYYDASRINKIFYGNAILLNNVSVVDGFTYQTADALMHYLNEDIKNAYLNNIKNYHLHYDKTDDKPFGTIDF